MADILDHIVDTIHQNSTSVLPLSPRDGAFSIKFRVIGPTRCRLSGMPSQFQRSILDFRDTTFVSVLRASRQKYSRILVDSRGFFSACKHLARMMLSDVNCALYSSSCLRIQFPPLDDNSIGEPFFRFLPSKSIRFGKDPK